MTDLSQSRSTRVADPEAARELHDFARQIGESMQLELKSRLEGLQPDAQRAIGDTIGHLFPQLLERHLLGKRSAGTRARLLHALSVLNLQRFQPDEEEEDDAEIVQAVSPMPEAGDALTSEEAAKLLNVSRTHINRLVADNKLGSVAFTEGGHRRILRAAVLAYKAESFARHQRALTDMVRAGEDAGMYDNELDGIPQRKSS